MPPSGIVRTLERRVQRCPIGSERKVGEKLLYGGMAQHWAEACAAGRIPELEGAAVGHCCKDAAVRAERGVQYELPLVG
jgi:hypothetical protein